MATSPPPAHRLHSALSHPLLRRWHTPTIDPSQLVYPLFIVEDEFAKESIAALPGQHRWGLRRLVDALAEPVRRGLKAVLLFGVVTGDKDETGSRADVDSNPVIKALPLLRDTFPDLLLITDVCLCPYTSHGHCGVLNEDLTINNDVSIARMAEISVAYAAAGAHVIAPSDMMDGRIGAIKAALKEAGRESVPVMSYAAKYQSCFYGPFREAAQSGMSFGDRSGYQLPPGSRELGLRAVDRDIAEGADFVMVKPGMPYLDIIRDTKERVSVPVAVYQVSGEYAMLYHAAMAAALDLKSAVMESLASFQRAGATIIISYFAPQVLEWMAEDAEALKASDDAVASAAEERDVATTPSVP